MKQLFAADRALQAVTPQIDEGFMSRGRGREERRRGQEETASLEASRSSPFSLQSASQGFLETMPHAFPVVEGGGDQVEKARRLLG